VPRRDAVRNRRSLIAAGRDVFAERGERASLEEIARRAGVGIGTLYRHFPTREALVEAIFEEHIDAVVAAAERAAAADAWEGLVGFLEQVLELQARNLPLRDVFVRHSAGEGRVAERRRRIGVLLRRLVARARKQGYVRDDFTVGDLVFAMWSFMPLLEASAAVAPNAWRRHLRILLDGFRPAGATRQRVRPLTAPQLEAAVGALRSGYRRRRAA
jgi:AcrR family transcriptional regulator